MPSTSPTDAAPNIQFVGDGTRSGDVFTWFSDHGIDPNRFDHDEAPNGRPVAAFPPWLPTVLGGTRIAHSYRGSDNSTSVYGPRVVVFQNGSPRYALDFSPLGAHVHSAILVGSKGAPVVVASLSFSARPATAPTSPRASAPSSLGSSSATAPTSPSPSPSTNGGPASEARMVLAGIEPVSGRLLWRTPAETAGLDLVEVDGYVISIASRPLKDSVVTVVAADSGLVASATTIASPIRGYVLARKANRIYGYDYLREVELAIAR